MLGRPSKPNLLGDPNVVGRLIQPTSQDQYAQAYHVSVVCAGLDSSADVTTLVCHLTGDELVDSAMTLNAADLALLTGYRYRVSFLIDGVAATSQVIANPPPLSPIFLNRPPTYGVPYMSTLSVRIERLTDGAQSAPPTALVTVRFRRGA